VRFYKKIRTENVFLGKTISGAFEAKSGEVFVQNNFDGNQGGPGLKDPLQVLDGPITMGQLQDQEPRRSRKQCKDWCNPLGMKLARAQH
jgi:hypothetical protein